MKHKYTGDAAMQLDDGRLVRPGETVDLPADHGRPDFEPVVETQKPTATSRSRKGRDSE